MLSEWSTPAVRPHRWLSRRRAARWVAGCFAAAMEFAAFLTDAGAQPKPVGNAVQVVEPSQQGITRAALAADGSFVVTWKQPDGLYGKRFNRNGVVVGSPFVVSSHQLGELAPGHHAMSMDAAGNFVVAWDTGRNGLLAARRFDSSGTPLGGRFVVTESSYYTHSMASSANGDLLIVWSENGGGVFARRYDSDGNPRGARIAVSDDAGGFSPDVALRDDGSFIVAWKAFSQSHGEIAARQFDPGGNPIGGSFLVNSTTTGYQQFPDVGVADDGSFVVVWEDRRHVDDIRVQTQRFDRNGGHLGGEIEIASGSDTRYSARPLLAAQPNGDFTVFWEGYWRVLGQHVAGGTKRGNQFPVGSGGKTLDSVARGEDGTIMVTWELFLEDHSGSPNWPGGVFAQRFRLGAAAGPRDDDLDGVSNGVDNCPTVKNPEQTDINDDGYGDDCVAADVVIPATTSIGLNPIIGTGTTIGPGVVIGDDPVIGENVRIDRQVRAGRRLRVEDDAILGQRSTLRDDVTIGGATRLDGPASIGNGVVIGDRAVLRRHASAADRATIGPLVSMGIGSRVGRRGTVEMGATLGRGAIVSPNAVVPAGVTVPPGTTFP